MAALVFWLDVDNTLLNNDYVKEDQNRHLKEVLDPKLVQRFWDLYEEVREETDVVDIPLALQRLRERTTLAEIDEQTYARVLSIFIDYSFSEALYPHVMETIAHLNTLGVAVIVSDGDRQYQAMKINNSNLANMVGERVLLYVHKQDHLEEVMHLYPGDHYVMVDDKPQILVDIKQRLGERVTGVFVCQGKYALQQPEHFKPDITVDKIGDLRSFTAEQFLG